ncbi:PAS domain-containing protein [Altibacter sp. HG106]|uniref:PAS domain-containing protein n=1 Tax=Altibacter sp. HG106 TaxID=3023937 RepID=UPI00234FF2B0|nr:PAS domain-containing protein [Altibacter sp. HG106]MDC7994449.1 PAS domain-containing protein [Altibacter sp. HG106]
MIRLFFWLENLSKRNIIRVLMIAIPVAISAIYTNSSNAALETQIGDLKSKNTLLQAKLRNQESEYDRLKSNMILLSLADDTYPNPKWLKSTDGIMLRLNKAYEDLFLRPLNYTRSDYIGNDDYAIFSKDIADNFRKHDRYVLKIGKPVTFMETVIMPDGTRENVEVTKYPWIVNGHTLGVAGYMDIDYFSNYLKTDDGE